MQKRPHVSPGKDTNERRENPPLLERIKAPPGQHGKSGAAADSLFGRTQYNTAIYHGYMILGVTLDL
ncbi:MAG: hypothetical protein B6D34_02840 [Candidatus Brocadia sp. UTAMX1]|nr:MAG: hypothetical protein B6D34_02840 [Candidatus Brocadia sp. UTAMX1]